MIRRDTTSDLIEGVLSGPGRAAVSCSFQAGGVALVHMLRRRQPDIPVLFVDTGYHFPETLEFRDEVTEAWDLNLRVLTSDLTVAEQEDRFGILNRTDADRCCAIRKVEPLYRALEEFEVWLTAVRRDQSPTRAGTRPIEGKLLPQGQVIQKVNPLTHWSWDDIDAYHQRHRLPLHPLYDHGYQSIGCAPCTIPLSANGGREGRWPGLEKAECGLHTLTEDIV